jgi:hypothetical protein
MQKIKNFLISEKGKNVLTVGIIILVGLASFGLGRLSKESSGGLKIEYTTPPTVQEQVLGAQSVKTVNANIPKTYFASSRGSKYYSLGCSGGKTIKEENKIYFNSKEEAERAGYELSASCK